MHATGLGDHFHIHQTDAITNRADLVIDQGDDIGVIDMLLAVGQILEAYERFLEGIVAQLVAQFLQLVLEGGAAGMLAHDQGRFLDADAGRGHDFVGLGILQHAVLVDAAFMREGILANDRLVVLHREIRRGRHDLAGTRQMRRLDIGVEGHGIAAGAQRHHDFLQRRIAGAFAQAIDRAFDLPRTASHTGQRIGDGHAQIVMTVHREDRLVGARHAFDDGLEHAEMLFGHRIADCIGQVDGSGAGLDGRLDAALEKLDGRAGGVHGRPFDIVDQIARLSYRAGDDLDDLVLGLLHLVGQMDRRGGDKGVDAALLGVTHGFAGAIDIGADGTSQASDAGALDMLGDGDHGLEVTHRSNRETGFDNIDAHFVQRVCNLQLFFQRHGGAGRLLAIAQGGVENEDAFFIGIGRRSRHFRLFPIGPEAMARWTGQFLLFGCGAIP